jgi:hypothetical protein
VDIKRIPPAGDGFYAKGLHDGQDEREETEEYALYLCRRCLGNSR